MIHETRARVAGSSRTGRQRLAIIIGRCSLFLLIASFAAMPLVVSAHDGGKGNDDRTAEVEKHGNDGQNHDANDDHGQDRNHDANDDRGQDRNHDVNDDHGNDPADHDVNDDNGVDANGMPIPLVVALNSGR